MLRMVFTFKCPECGQSLDMDEAAYGHDCEVDT